MSAYVISEVEILDEAVAQRYREIATTSIAQYGGRFLARGAAPVALEGDIPPERRMVLVEFADVDTARKWYDSPEYAEALTLAEKALRRRLLLVAGLPQAG